jgi:hypothetical protein
LNYYNEYDKKAAAWIRELMAVGLIPEGEVDERSMPVESGTSPLAHGVPERVGRLRGYGNAIVPQVAAAFIESCEVGLSV